MRRRYSRRRSTKTYAQVGRVLAKAGSATISAGRLLDEAIELANNLPAAEAENPAFWRVASELADVSDDMDDLIARMKRAMNAFKRL